jgi:hypothetical protein
MDAISEIQMGANILLAYFHYSCKGYRVFEEGWKAEEMKSMASLSEEQAQFIQTTAAYVKTNSMHLSLIIICKVLKYGKGLTSLRYSIKSCTNMSTTLLLNYTKKIGSQDRLFKP